MLDLIRSLEESAKQQGLENALQQQSFVESFLAEEPAQAHEVRFVLKYEASLIQEVIEWLLLEDGFSTGGGGDFSRGLLTAKIKLECSCNEGWLAGIHFHRSQLHLTFEVRVKVFQSGLVVLNASRNLSSWFDQIQDRLNSILDSTPSIIEKRAHQAAKKLRSHGVRRDVVRRPGKPLTRAFTGNLRDYSGCAKLEELDDLKVVADDTSGLPLGLYGFDDGRHEYKPGPMLYLSTYGTKAPMEYNGALIVAPQNSGKTQLIIRWAAAANRAGSNSFIVDVKGNFMEKLRDQGVVLAGKVYYFSTDPSLAPPATHSLNFLGGLQGITPADRKTIEQLVDALLPQEGWESGENLYFRQLWSRWLRALIHVLKQFEYYFIHDETEIFDLSDLYRIASTEDLLYEFLKQIKLHESRLVAAGTAPLSPSIDYWITELAQLITPDHPDIRGGQRESRYTYQSLTVGILSSLRPFSKGGTLYDRIQGKGDFSLDQLDGDEQVTIVLAARAQDLEDSATVVTLAMKRLQQLLFQRMGKKPARRILLLLDETRRIRGFKAGEYITFAREAKAGCVLVYQSITQIRNEQEITEILENVGTQIYLGSLVGETARRFIDILPKRFRRSFSENNSYSGKAGLGTSWDERQELVDYFNTQDLYRLPAGKWPALVYIKDHVSRKPFIVDMDEMKDRTPK